MMILSMISEVHFFNSALFGKTVLLKNSKNVNVSLKKHTPLKKRYVRSNQAPFVNKTITKEIKKQPHLRNKFLNIKSEIDRKAYKKQHNYCTTLFREAQQTFSGNVNTTYVTDNKTFWRIVKPFFHR